MTDTDPNRLSALTSGGIPLDRKTALRDFVSLLKGQNLVPANVDASFEDPEDAEKPFAPHYEKHVRPHVESFERKRIETLQVLRKRALIAIPIYVVGTVVLLYVGDGDYVLFWLALAMAVLSFWCYMPVKQFQSAVKGEIFPSIFSFFGEDFQYSEEGRLSIESLEPSDIIPSYRTEETEDYIKGSYKGVELELTEAWLSQRSKRKDEDAAEFKFKGLFILLSMNKNFSGKTIVVRDAGNIFNWVASKFRLMEKVALEDPVFEKKFEVYSTDQVEARYLLTTSFMERLLELSASFGDSGLQCSFYDDRLLLMIASKKDHFEIASIFQPSVFTDDINTILREMSMIFRIIDDLKLHQRTGL